MLNCAPETGGHCITTPLTDIFGPPLNYDPGSWFNVKLWPPSSSLSQWIANAWAFPLTTQLIVLVLWHGLPAVHLFALPSTFLTPPGLPSQKNIRPWPMSSPPGSSGLLLLYSAQWNSWWMTDYWDTPCIYALWFLLDANGQVMSMCDMNTARMHLVLIRMCLENLWVICRPLV